MFLNFLSYCARQRLRNLPGVLEFQMGFQPHPDMLATAQSKVCVDGFPRSGNGFSTSCARAFADLPAEGLARHTHSVANIWRAVRLGLPTFVLVRAPLDSCVSLTAMMGAQPGQLADCLDAWRVFYEGVNDVLPDVTLVPFPVLIEQPYQLAARVAEAVGVTPPPLTSDFSARMELVRRARDAQRQHQDGLRSSLPNAAKQAAKQAILDNQMTGAARQALERCDEVHGQLLTSAPDILAAA